MGIGTPPLLIPKTMEVFRMKYDRKYDLREALEARKREYRYYTRSDNHSNSRKGKWDYIIRAACTGCRRTLSRYNNLHKLAFCFSCPRIFSPETVIVKEYSRKRPYRYQSNRSW